MDRLETFFAVPIFSLSARIRAHQHALASLSDPGQITMYVTGSSRLAIVRRKVRFEASQRKWTTSRQIYAIRDLAYVNGYQQDKDELILSAPDKWKQSFQKLLKSSGFDLCRMAWKGYISGRDAFEGSRTDAEIGGPVPYKGAIFANKDVRLKKEDDETVNQVPAFFVSREKLLALKPAEIGIETMELILERIDLYDPDKQFVVVYTDVGMTGCDIVTPQISPSEC
mmetsp:Transcript_3069/g.4700  ORF Transcript_3069/g.4700 Transcript_3069/m.4700 type:complete len:226 (+) Transcript_3069:91-768(+)